MKRRATWLAVTAGINLLLLFVLFYKTAFSLWMTAHPVYSSDWWRSRFYSNVFLTLGSLIVEVILVLMLVRGRARQVEK
jgi:hypothetical protein